MIKPIEILSPNLLEKAQILSFSAEETPIKQGAKNTFSDGFCAVFEDKIKADKILIKTADIQNISIYYKQALTQAEYQLFEDFSTTVSGADILVNFNSTLEAQELKFIFSAENVEINFNYFLLLENYLVLDKALSSFNPSNYIRGGYHYSLDGSLIAWRDLVKNSGLLSLENLPQETKTVLEELYEQNIFLTFIFYGGRDLSQSGEYALTSAFNASLNRTTGLWSVNLDITEK